MLRSVLKAITPPLLWSIGKGVKTKISQVQGDSKTPWQPEARHGKFTFENHDSFYALYKDYFVNEKYKFVCKTQTPLIIDGGANIGVSCRYWKFLYPEAEVIAFEPDETNFGLLQKNMEGFTSFQAEKKALWSSHGTLPFNAVGGEGGHVSKANPDVQTKMQTVVPTYRLRDLLGKKVDLLKLDIEGAELEVLQDCQDQLKNVERIFVEHHSFLGQTQKIGKFFGILENAGFRTNIRVDLQSKQPFLERITFNNKDCWLNVYAFRE